VLLEKGPLSAFGLRFAAFFGVFLATGSASAAVTKGPYLQSLGATSTQIRIEFSPATPASVEIFSRTADGGTPGAVVARAESPLGEMHSLQVGGLEPSTSYRYVVTAGKQTTSGEFTTAPADDSKNPFSFLLYGDNRTNDDAHATVVRQMLQSPGDFLVNTGDLVEDGNQPALWQNFFAIEGNLIRERCVFAAVGNHELHEASGANFLKYFGDDDPSLNGLRRLYRTVRWENMRFFFLNGMDVFASSDERTWLDQELAKADAEPNLVWRVVVLHQGAWSSGPHGNNPRLWDAGIVDVLRAHKIDLILSGHDHIYERGDAAGLKYVVSGGGGAPLYEVGKKLPTTKKAESTFHFVETKVDGDKLAMTVRRSDGTLLENCGFQKNQPWDCDGVKKLASELAKPSTIPDPGDPQAAQNLDQTPTKPKSKCGCELVGQKSPESATPLLLLLCVPLLRRRKRSYAG
jgi:predicted phosphodiesterase